jgi:O-antigen ligase
MGWRAANSINLLSSGSTVIAAGAIVGLATAVASIAVKPAFVMIALCGFVILIPTLLVRDPKAYWLGVLVVTMPLDISKRLSAWLIDPQAIFDKFAMPSSGSITLDFYLTDLVFCSMAVLWAAELCLKNTRFYFPTAGYIFIFYLVWALIVSLIGADSIYLSVCEWIREILYFIFFLYIVNNVESPLQFRAVVAGLFIAFLIASASVIVFFVLGIGTEDFAFSTFYSRSDTGVSDRITLYESLTTFTKRSAGIFSHPALAACFITLTGCIVLSYATTARRLSHKMLLAALFGVGVVALYLTFSRSGFLGLIAGSAITVTCGWWSRVIPQKVFLGYVLSFAAAAAVATPIIVASLNARPETVSRRWELLDITLEAFRRRPILGVGLNNSSVAILDGQKDLRDRGGKRPEPTPVNSHYLVILVDVGIIGFLLFFGFFWLTVVIALRTVSSTTRDMKVLLVGLLGSLAGLATQNFGDNALGGYTTNILLWLLVGLIIAGARLSIVTSSCHQFDGGKGN